MITKYTYENWTVKLENNMLLVYCILGDKTFTKQYNLTGTFDVIDMNGQYIHLMDYMNSKTMVQFKFESESELFGRTFDVFSNELLETIAEHDFDDDYRNSLTCNECASDIDLCECKK